MPRREHLRTLISLEGLRGCPVKKTVMAGFNCFLEKILSVHEFKSVYQTLPPCCRFTSGAGTVLFSRLRDWFTPVFELGRTFIRAEYQKAYAPLMLLWKGIGQYIARHPRYRTLFGAVSISSDYGHSSRRLMAAFLKMSEFSSELLRMVKPRKPFRRDKEVSLIEGKEDLHGNDLDELSSWISSIEEDGKGVPILIKQYVKLGGEVLSFNVDRHFSDALDGLMVVDLTRADHKVLKRYMGAEGFREFMDCHFGRKPTSLYSHR